MLLNSNKIGSFSRSVLLFDCNLDFKYEINYIPERPIRLLSELANWK